MFLGGSTRKVNVNMPSIQKFLWNSKFERWRRPRQVPLTLCRHRLPPPAAQIAPPCRRYLLDVGDMTNSPICTKGLAAKLHAPPPVVERKAA